MTLEEERKALEGFKKLNLKLKLTEKYRLSNWEIEIKRKERLQKIKLLKGDNDWKKNRNI